MSARVDWSEHHKLLGTMFDREVAAIVGCSQSAVFSRRKAHGIPTYSGDRETRGRKPMDLSDYHDLLGTMSDYDLADRAGCSRGAIRRRRVARGIPPFKKNRETPESRENP